MVVMSLIWMIARLDERRESVGVSGRFLGISGRDPSVSKSKRSHVDIFRISLYI